MLNSSASDWVESNIKKVIAPTDYINGEPTAFYNRFISGSSYSPAQKELIAEVVSFSQQFMFEGEKSFREQSPDYKELVRDYYPLYFLLSKFDYIQSMRKLVTLISENELKAESIINHYIPPINNIYLVCNNYSILFSYKNGNYYLTCDLDTNRELLLSNILMLTVWDFYNTHSSLLLLDKIQCYLKNK